MALSGTSWAKASMIADYGENIAYDGNGNILSYIRKGTGTSLQMDRLAYSYNRSSNAWLTNNQLQFIKDTVATSTYANDLTSQSAGNYAYDPTGNLTQDATSGITNIDWSVYGKIQTIYKGTGNLTYTYDAAGHRVSKTQGTSTTWYVRDAQGNTLAVYDNSNSTMTWKEQHLYGSSRLGIWTPNLNVGTGNTSDPNAEYGIAGRKYYELNNHLGNVLSTISDKRIQAATNVTPLLLAEVITAQDYYPFGMLQPGRQFTGGANTYRFGFNGKENDNEVKGVGNEQDYGARIYDPRVGRFYSKDLLSIKYPELSTYQFASNSPILAVDVDGLEGGIPIYYSKVDLRGAYLSIKSELELRHEQGMNNVAMAEQARQMSINQGRDGDGINWFTKTKVYISSWWFGGGVNGLVPGSSNIEDVKDAGKYYKQGRYGMMTLSAFFALPEIGNISKAFKALSPEIRSLIKVTGKIEKAGEVSKELITITWTGKFEHALNLAKGLSGVVMMPLNLQVSLEAKKVK